MHMYLYVDLYSLEEKIVELCMDECKVRDIVWDDGHSLYFRYYLL